MKKNFRKKMRSWTFWLAVGMMGISCAFPWPKRTEPPPPFLRPVSAPKQVKDAPRQSAVAPEKASPAALPARAEPLPGRQGAPPGKVEPKLKETFYGPGRQGSPPPAPSEKVKPKLKETFYVHTVRYYGETISIIAAWYTGDGENWKALARANPKIDPKSILESNQILIPERLLKTREAMPQKFVNRFYPKSVKGKSRPKSQPAQSQEEEPKLFGPKKR
jgi:hypothetical protein